MKQIWFGMGHVRRLSGCTALNDDMIGAYIPIVGFASSSENFLLSATTIFNEDKLFLVELENIKDISLVDRHELSDDVIDIIERLSVEWPLQYRVAYNYPIDDA